MNSKIENLKTERASNLTKIAKLQARNRELDSKILELENTSIIGMVRECSLTPDKLAEFLQAMKDGRLPVIEENAHEN